MPLLHAWFDETLKTHASQAKSLSSKNWKTLSRYVPETLLNSTPFVVVETLPMPPLGTWGLHQFQHFEHEPFVAISYLNTIFIQAREVDNEAILFHELVHILQWKILGRDRFLELYIEGLLEGMYYTSPLEVMAYKLQEEFEASVPPFDLEERVARELKPISSPLTRKK